MKATTTVILRECGERTAERSFDALSKVFSSECIFRISDRPFSKTLLRSLELGHEQGRPYTLCIDADVIPIGQQLLNLITEFEAMPKHVVELQGLVFDRLFLVDRPAGNHLYRTALLKKALKQIPAEGTSLRPESDMLSSLTKTGRPWLQSRINVGSHDFGQHYEDVYRKAFLHARKHAEFRDYLKATWSALAANRPDFRVALAALEDHDSFDGSVMVDRSFLEKEAKERIAELNLPENDTEDSRAKLLPSLNPDLRDQRDQVEAAMHQKMFRSRGAWLRKFLSFRGFQFLMSR
ncbi:MAG: hypothetical protein ACI8UO_000437 [Verrucomicrobiales bacterium]|jgi:hypothetical protein